MLRVLSACWYAYYSPLKIACTEDMVYGFVIICIERKNQCPVTTVNILRKYQQTVKFIIESGQVINKKLRMGIKNG